MGNKLRCLRTILAHGKRSPRERAFCFLREHIVSTIDVPGAAVREQPAEDGRPLRAYAEDLARADETLLARLRDMTDG
jgi:hypothetical protein